MYDFEVEVSITNDLPGGEDLLSVALAFEFADDGNKQNGQYTKYLYYKDFNSLAYYEPEKKFVVPTIYLGDILNGKNVTRKIHFWCYDCIPGADPLAAIISASYNSKRDCFVNRDTSVGIALYPNEFYYDLKTNYPDRPATAGNASVFAESIAVRTSPPEGWINPLWNWISIPNKPVDPKVESIFGAGVVDNKLFRWNPVTKNIELFPNDFTTMETGRGYVLAASEAMKPTYKGIPYIAQQEILIPAAGWIWIGHPFEKDLDLTNVSVFKIAGGQTRTALEDFDAADPWLNWNLLYWDSGVDTCKILGIVGGDDDTLHAWYGYRLWANVEGLRLRIPPPE